MTKPIGRIIVPSEVVELLEVLAIEDPTRLVVATRLVRDVHRRVATKAEIEASKSSTFHIASSKKEEE